jgi:hypothetical protein
MIYSTQRLLREMDTGISRQRAFEQGVFTGGNKRKGVKGLAQDP